MNDTGNLIYLNHFELATTRYELLISVSDCFNDLIVHSFALF